MKAPSARLGNTSIVRFSLQPRRWRARVSQAGGNPGVTEMSAHESRLNRAWHQAHRMPARATRAQRVAWHAEHARACGCRGLPESIRAEVEALLAAEGQRPWEPDGGLTDLKPARPVRDML
jgi:hypothetical protein